MVSSVCRESLKTENVAGWGWGSLALDPATATSRNSASGQTVGHTRQERVENTMAKRNSTPVAAQEPMPNPNPETVAVPDVNVDETLDSGVDVDEDDEDTDKTEQVEIGEPVQIAPFVFTQRVRQELVERLGRGRKPGQEPRKEIAEFDVIRVTSTDAFGPAFAAFFAPVAAEKAIEAVNENLNKLCVGRKKQEVFKTRKSMDAAIAGLRSAGLDLEAALALVRETWGSQ